MTGGVYEIYERVDDLIIRLRAEGVDTWADKLNDAMRYGSTGGEIVDALGFHLRELKVCDEISESARAVATEILGGIGTIGTRQHGPRIVGMGDGERPSGRY